MHFDLVDLRLFARVAELNSITRGADASHMSTSAASVRIKNLEDNLGSKLLFRSAQGVTLTPAGQSLVQHARLVLAQIEQLQGDMQEYARGIKGHLRIFANTTALGEFLPPVLHTYLRSHPDVCIDLRERLSPDIVRAVSENHIDIGIVAGRVRTEALEVIPYRRDRLVLVIPSSHELACQRSVPFTQTVMFDHVGLHPASALNAFLLQICSAANMKLKLRIEVGNFEAACRMVEAGVGVTVVPQSAAKRHLENMKIRIVPLEDDWALRNLCICVRSQAALPVYARDLVEMLERDARNAEFEDSRS